MLNFLNIFGARQKNSNSIYIEKMSHFGALKFILKSFHDNLKFRWARVLNKTLNSKLFFIMKSNRRELIITSIIALTSWEFSGEGFLLTIRYIWKEKIKLIFKPCREFGACRDINECSSSPCNDVTQRKEKSKILSFQGAWYWNFYFL